MGTALPAYRLAAQCPDGSPPPCRAARTTPPAASERARRYAVIPFRNLSRSPELEWLTEGSVTLLGDVLGHWREVSVVPEERLLPALRRAGITPGAVAALPQLRRLGEATGGWTAITGDVLITGERVAVRARAIDVVTGRELTRASAEVPRTADVRNAFGQVGARLLSTAGLDVANADIGAATTRSLDAYRAYARGSALVSRNAFRGARDAFRESVRFDSTFAQGWAGLTMALLFQGPEAVLTPGGEFQQAIARAVALSERLPSKRRDAILALGTLFQGRFGAAREILDRLVLADSTDASLLGWRSFVEYVDPFLVSAPDGTWRRRSSLQHSIRLAERMLAVQPDNHGGYIPVTYGYLQAAGDLPGIQIGVTRELNSIGDLFQQVPTALYVPLLLRDSITPVPMDEYLQLPPDSVAAAQARALAAARTWVERWLAAGPREGAAHQASARISEVGGRFEEGLSRLATAESLGVEFGYIDLQKQRLGLLGKVGRYDAAAALADTLWRRGVFNLITIMPDDDGDALRWLFNLALRQGDFVRADTLLARYVQRVSSFAGPGPLAQFGALSVLAGRRTPPLWMTGLPLAMRLEALDRAHEHARVLPADAPMRATLATLARFAGEDVVADSALAARVRASPWYRP